MGQFLLKRVVSAVVTLFVVITLTFFLMHLVPGGPFSNEKLKPATIELMKKKYGMDKPLFVQYTTYLGNIVRGDFGLSLKRLGTTVNSIIAEKFPVSARLGGVALILAVGIGVPVGAYSALRRNKWQDKLIRVIATIGIAVPGFVMATTTMIFFGNTLKWLPTIGLDTPWHYILPAFALSFYPMSFIVRLMRSSMLDVITSDYVKTARAKGMSEGVVIFKHALRNSIIPVVTYLGPLTASILTGGFVIERIFAIPGLGKFFVDSISNRDYPLIMGTTVFYGALLIAMNVVVDIVYGIIDPRIKYD